MGRVLGRLADSDAVLLVRALLAVGAIWLFIGIADAVREGDMSDVDERILRALRDPAHPEDAIGPPWLEGVVRDVTALGSKVVLLIFTSAVAVFLAVRRQSHALVLLVVSTVGGMILADSLKQVFVRPRPELVPHLAAVYSTSFPSGHAMTSAVVYLTLGALLSQLVEERSAQGLLPRSRLLPDLRGGVEPRVPRGALPERRPRRMVGGPGLGPLVLDGGVLPAAPRKGGAAPLGHGPTLSRQTVYSFRRYARSGARSSGVNGRSKCTPSVLNAGGTTPGGAFTLTRLKNSV